MPRRGPSQRIVSLAPSITSILFAIGARHQVVGVTKWCKEVAAVGSLPRLGDCWTLDVEEVKKLRPTLVIGGQPYKPETVGKLLDSGVTFLATNPRTLLDIYQDFRMLGRITGRAPAAERLVRWMGDAFLSIAVRTRKKKSRPHVYCEAWPKPRISSPPWVRELVEIAGGRMVVPAGQRVTDDEVAQANPDVIIIAWTAAGSRPKSQTTLTNPTWQNVTAVRNRRVHVVRDELLNTPGPPLVEGARELFRLLHRKEAR